MSVSRPKTRTLLSLAATAALGLGGMIGTAGTATAAATAGGTSTTVTLPAGVTTAQVSSGAAHATITRTPQTAQTNLTCTLTSSTPIHTSSIVYGSASISCTAPVAQLTMTASLYKNGALLITGDLMETWSAKMLSANAYTAYAPGKYQTGSQGTVTYPSGYNPPTGGWGTTYSPTATL
ncbi:hypothetical protein [Kitasatospora sp. NBC_01302]|uniref:hypothetical protein n=1 Tax=Kitasatospora sp. NBC_01302 TaxID=2903575 RepID=UPI002E14205D|nr:hypothetical protein OG294_37355 [Kitasatospora sp. NBC_01302]